MQQDVHRFSRFDVHPARRQLIVEGQPVSVGARAFDVLLALVDRQGQLVSKQELLDLVWAGRVVEEGNLTVQVGTLRKALGADVIATIPGRGYCLTAAREAAPAPPGVVAPPAVPVAAALADGAQPGLIGREDDLAALDILLDAHRLVTITGAGGVGKTRLARQALRNRGDRYPDGAWWVELSGLATPELVPGSVASALGLQMGGGDPLAGLVSALRRARMMVVLDNAEHLADAVAALVLALNEGAPGVILLVTSQVPLRVNGERVYRLDTLLVPLGSESDEEAQRFGAVSLFVQRAQAADRRFALNADNVADVIAICRRLDGLPLALELAAARVPLLGVKALHAALDERLSLLTAGRRGAPPRQQTLRGALEWAHGLLSPQERAVYRRLAVFAGGFTLEMARRVIPDDSSPLDEWAVVDALGSLVDRSQVAVDSGESPRYHLLESPRAHAREQLDLAGETRTWRQRHARTLLLHCGRANDDLYRLSESAWSARYATEGNNLRAALDWALGEDGDEALGIALTAASAAVWWVLGNFNEGRTRIRAAIDRVRTETPPIEQARLQRWWGASLVIRMPLEAVQALEQAVAGFRNQNAVLELADGLIRLGRAYTRVGRFEAASRVLDEALPSLHAADVVRLLASHVECRGFLCKASGDLAGARRFYEQSLPMYQLAGAAREALRMRDALADTVWAQGDLDAARSGFESALLGMRESPLFDPIALGICLCNLAGVHVERGEVSPALELAREGLPLMQQVGFAFAALDHLAVRAATCGRLADAALIAGQVDAIYERRDARREANEARARARLQRLLSAGLSAGELGPLIETGARLSEEEACRLALLA